VRILVFFVTVILFHCQIQLYAQVKPVENVGSVKGIVRDSLYNHTLNAATVSIYTYPEGKLLAYQVTNNFGEFIVRNLPLTTSLNLIVSNVGYTQVSRKFNISKETKVADLKTVYTTVKTIDLREVKITIPPVQMNGDTLEFNAVAFKLDTNAVVEDLMKKIPNITLWGDGKITVNGREIKRLLVNGKDFMGGDPVVATQNIPKNAIDKIQVYNTVDNPLNPLDSILHMNLKLKRGKDVGYFGKIGGGYGTSSRFETDASFNTFSPSLQLAIVGASNNINKIAPNVNTLQRNSTFKGVGVQVDYMSDFRTAGINQPNTGGYTFKYDFRKKDLNTQHQNIITSDYFLQNNVSKQLSNSQTTMALANSIDRVENNNFQSENNYTNRRFNAGYQYSKDRYAIGISQNIDLGNNTFASKNQNTSSDEKLQLLSRSYSVNKSEGQSKLYGLKVDFSLQPNFFAVKRRFSGLNADYNIDVSERDGSSATLTEFESIADSSKNKKYNREYNNSSKSINQRINFNLPGILRLVSGQNGFKAFDIDFKNYLQINNNRSKNNVYDYDENLKQLIFNKYLTNTTEYNVSVYEPTLTVYKGIHKSLTHRFDRSWNFSLDLKGQLFYQNNQSEKSFQNINRVYRNFLPAASISFSDNQYGDYRSDLSVIYDRNTDIPEIGQLAPLTDSANVYYIRPANLTLKEAKREALTIKFNRSDEKKNNFNYKLSASISRKDNNIIDSLLVDEQNIRTVYKINSNSDNKHLNFSGSFNKALKLKNGELQLTYNTRYTYEKNPYIINSVENSLMSNSYNNNLIVNYTHKSVIAVEAKQSVSNNDSKRSNINGSQFKSRDISTSLSASYNATKKLKINSNISLVSSSSTGLKDIQYNIWNASTVYRFLKGNNLELKFSALDLLKQNTSVINRNTGGSITLGSVSVLQQYFMFGLSYYPRKFGKDIKK